MPRRLRLPAVTFASPGTPPEGEGDMVRRRGVIFRAGDYPTHGFAMTPAELAELARDFTPVPIDHGHSRSAGPLDGKMGTLESVELSEDGTTLYGTAAFPTWLETTLGDARRLVSATFAGRADKRLKALSLVTKPQISDADLQVAFSAATGCACDAADDTPETKDEPMADAFDKLILLTKGMDDVSLGAIIAQIEAGGGQVEFSSLPGFEAAVEARLEEELRKHDEVTFAAQAEEFAAAMVKEHKIAPADKAKVAKRYVHEAMEDRDRPVEFAAGEKFSRLEEFKANLKGRNAHGLTEEVRFAQPPAGAFALSNGIEAPESPEEYAKRVNARVHGRDRIGSNGNS